MASQQLHTAQIKPLSFVRITFWTLYCTIWATFVSLNHHCCYFILRLLVLIRVIIVCRMLQQWAHNTYQFYHH